MASFLSSSSSVLLIRLMLLAEKAWPQSSSVIVLTLRVGNALDVHLGQACHYAFVEDPHAKGWTSYLQRLPQVLKCAPQCNTGDRIVRQRIRALPLSVQRRLRDLEGRFVTRIFRSSFCRRNSDKTVFSRETKRQGENISSVICRRPRAPKFRGYGRRMLAATPRDSGLICRLNSRITCVTR